jgi:integrase
MLDDRKERGTAMFFKQKFVITEKVLLAFENTLRLEEKARKTVSAYCRAARSFAAFANNVPATQGLAIAWKESLGNSYKPASINQLISGLNKFCAVYRLEIRLKSLKIQQPDSLPEEKLLTEADVRKLLNAARSRELFRLYYILQTFLLTGIRVSELRFITVAAVAQGFAEVTNKGKTRRVDICRPLKALLFEYIQSRCIASGAVFVTRTGRSVEASNIWRQLKLLARLADVAPGKVFPHNFRHYFARAYYQNTKDLDGLARILGHSNVNTTRIYTVDSGKARRKALDRQQVLGCAA